MNETQTESQKPSPASSQEVLPTEEEMLQALAKFTRQSRRKDVQGLIPQRVAARVLGVSEARVRKLVENQRIRLFRYPQLKMAGVAVRDVLEVLEERKERLAARAGEQSDGKPSGSEQ